MINNAHKISQIDMSNNPLYFSNRKNIIEIIQTINTALNNSSQTFFLALYYMDLILTNKNYERIFKLFYEDKEDDLKSEISINDLVMFSLACLIIATKYNENDPHVPNIISFINLCSYYTYNKYNFQVEQLYRAEVIILKFIEYKLNYFTIYHYFTFIFGHGFLPESIFDNELMKETKYSKDNKDELLEKIYILSREIIDKFIEDNENIIYIIDYKNYFTPIQILIWSAEHILNLSLVNLFKNEKNIFELIYGINYLENKENNEILKNKIQIIYDNIQRIKEEINNHEIENQMNSETEKNIQNEIENKENHIPNAMDLTLKNQKQKPKQKQNNNMLISSDNFYLEKYNNKDNYNFNKMSQNENQNPNNHIKNYIPKYKYIPKYNNNIKSKSTNIYRYNQLFQLRNNNNHINKYKYNYSSNKKQIVDNKESNEREEKGISKQKNLESIVENLDNKFLKSTNLTIYKNLSNSNNIKNLQNSNNLMYFSGYNNPQSNNNINLHESNDYEHKSIKKSINFSRSHSNQKYMNHNNKLKNENSKDIMYKTKAILNNFNFSHTKKPYNFKNNKNNYENHGENKFINFNKLDDNNNNFTLKNKKSYMINDRYAMKENIQDNNINAIYNKSNLMKNKSIDFPKYRNNNLNLFNTNKIDNIYRKEENKINNNFSSSYGTYYQYDKLNKYENIDNFCNEFQRQYYNPCVFQSWNKCY